MPLVGTTKSGEATDVGAELASPSRTILAGTRTEFARFDSNATTEGDTTLYVVASELASTPVKADCETIDVGSDGAIVAVISVAADMMLSEARS